MSEYRPPAPWVHTGVRCAECRARPIKGYRYKYLKNDYDLCGKCFKKKVPEEDVGLFLKIARRDGCPPFQVRPIECDACGEAPISFAPMYKRKQEADSQGAARTSTWLNLCESCFEEQDEEGKAQFEKAFSISHLPRIPNYVTSTYYNLTCFHCSTHPVEVPAYGKYLAGGKDAGLDKVCCYGCFDDLKRNEGLDASQWEEMKDCDPFHLTQLSCYECGSNPIKGTAFRHPSKLEEIICYRCHWNKSEEPGKEYTVIDAPPTLRGALRLATAEASATVEAGAGGANDAASELLQQLRSVHEQQLSFQLETMKLQNLVALSAASASMMARW